MLRAAPPAAAIASKRTQLGLIVLACLAMVVVAVSGLLSPRRSTTPPLKKPPSETPTRQEPSRRPNNSLDPQLVCFDRLDVSIARSAT